MKDMISELRPALVSLAVLTLLLGVAYPLAVTGVAQAVFAEKANGSLVVRDGKPIASRLVGQCWDDPRWFWGRPSAVGCDGAASGGSNLGPRNPALREAVQARILALRKADPELGGPVPVDLVTASASGLDPHVSPEAALFQVRRVARARKLDEGRVRALVDAHTEGRFLGVYGAPHCHVLELNLALADLK